MDTIVIECARPRAFSLKNTTQQLADLRWKAASAGARALTYLPVYLHAFTVKATVNWCNAPIGRVTSEVTAVKGDNNYFVVRRRGRYWKFSSR